MWRIFSNFKCAHKIDELITYNILPFPNMYAFFLNLYEGAGWSPKWPTDRWKVGRQSVGLFSYMPLLLCLLFPLGLKSQFIPGLYSDVKSDRNYEFTLVRDEPWGMSVNVQFVWSQDGTPHTISVWVNDQLIDSVLNKWKHSGYEHISGWAGRVIPGSLKAGTKVRLKARLDAPENPSAQLLSLSIQAISYDATANLTKIESKVLELEHSQKQIGQNANKIIELGNQLSMLKAELNTFRQQFGAFSLGQNSRLDSLDMRATSLENSVKDVSQRFKAHQATSNQRNAETSSRFNTINQAMSQTDLKISSLEEHYKTLSDRAVSLENNV
ncbi:MAG: hypothetical protein C5B47_00695, partial [Verrucomicrobia bacterium]